MSARADAVNGAGRSVSARVLPNATRRGAYSSEPDGEEFIDKHGHTVLGWHARSKGQDAVALLAEFQAYWNEVYGAGVSTLLMRPILTREMGEIECRINGCEEGAFTRCTERAKNPKPMWQIEIDPGEDG